MAVSDLEEILRLTKIGQPLKVTIHKAIDGTPNLLHVATEMALIIGITGILTSEEKLLLRKEKKL